MGLSVNIKKKTGDFFLDVSFETENSVLGLLGASGCGKSMTLKCIAGVEKPDEGRIVLNDRVLFDSEKGINLPPQKRKVGYLFQDYALFPNMTVLQNVKCGSKDLGKAKEYIKKYALEGTEDLYPDQLSGGQKQRVALARMLSSNPETILLDEPFTALDNFLKARLERQIMEVIEDVKAPIIFVSHDRNEVYRLTDTIAVMENGHIVDISEKHELFKSPKTLASTLLTGCKNVTRLKRQENGNYFATDWGIKLCDAPFKDKEYRFAGFRAHDLKMVTNGNEFGKENILHSEIVREVEDTFSVVIQFFPKGLEEKTEYSLLTYETDPSMWNDIKENMDGRTITMQIPDEAIIWMSE
ncbi:MAG: ATP-binding cassette domain-containing protein [Butyrivibrio sp.]|nr:ATP-binding cassette domain-containing protein [Butyrivibrio sp.]